jgi:hypothetical protein
MNATSTRQSAAPLPQVFGRYLLMQRLSRGGMGEIFVARHGLSGFEKLVVIKKVLPHLAEDEQFISRFVDEAQVAIKLQHANIAQVFEVGRVNNEYFLSLEYVEGRDIRRTLSTLYDRDERLPLDMALYIAREVAAGLSYAHRRTDESGDSLELVHCDISPPNIMVSFEGEVKIIDFGIAKSSMRGTETDPKMGFGKFGYMAPEQLIRGGEVDWRTDIYACGVVLYELLTGERLYEMGETPDYRALARQVAKGQHPLPSERDPELAPYDALVARALHPKLEQRFQSAAELRDAIQHALVAINPTMNAEHAGAFMRVLYADEMAEQRRVMARAESTDLREWEQELTTQSATTVSYALAHMPLVAPTEDATALVDRNRAITSDPLATPRAPWSRSSRRGMMIALIAIAVLTGGSVLAWVLGGDDGKRAGVAATKSEPGPAKAGGGGEQDELDLAPDVVDATPPAPSVTAIEPDAGVEEGDMPAAAKMARARRRAARTNPRSRARSRVARKSRAKKKKTRTAAKAKKTKPPPSAVDGQAVRRRFGAVSSEYRRFKKRYGGRLTREWNDLATFATFARSSPDKLKVLDRKISRFRRLMRANRK